MSLSAMKLALCEHKKSKVRLSDAREACGEMLTSRSVGCDDDDGHEMMERFECSAGELAGGICWPAVLAAAEISKVIRPFESSCTE